MPESSLWQGEDHPQITCLHAKMFFIQSKSDFNDKESRPKFRNGNLIFSSQKDKLMQH